jgi:hypothetical protein
MFGGLEIAPAAGRVPSNVSPWNGRLSKGSRGFGLAPGTGCAEAIDDVDRVTTKPNATRTANRIIGFPLRV